MEFKRHLGKGIWAFADKALPAIWGVANIFLVQRVLPISEYAGLAVVLQVFLVVSTLCTSLAFQPLVKYVAEREDPLDHIIASAMIGLTFLLLCIAAITVLKEQVIGLLDKGHQGNLNGVYGFLPAMLLGSLIRGLALNILQARYQVKQIFMIDAAYFLGVPTMIVIAQMLGWYGAARDVLVINTIALWLSSTMAMPLIRPFLRGRWRISRGAVRDVWDFGKYVFSGSAMYTAFAQSDLFFVSGYAGILAVAPYSVAKTFTRVFDIITQVIQMFLVPFSAKASSQNQTASLVAVAEKTICFATLVFFPVFVLFFFFPTVFLHVLYHGKFDDAAPILRVLSWMAFLIPWASPAASYLLGFGRVREGFVSSVGLMAISIPLYIILTPVFGSVGTAAGSLIAFFIVSVGLTLYLKKLVPFRFAGVLSRVGDIWVFLKGVGNRLIPGMF